MFLEHFFSDDLGHVEIMPFHDGNSETFKKHLPPWMTKICVYYYYKSWAEDDNAILRDLATESEVKLASFDTFRRTWKEDFPDVTTPKVKRFSHCPICAAGKALRDQAREICTKDMTPEERQVHRQHQQLVRRQVRAEQKVHLERVRQERRDLNNAVFQSRLGHGNFFFFEIDSMDSAKTLLPHWVRIPKTVKPDMLLKYHLTCVKYDGYRPDDIYYYTNTIPHDSSTTCTLIWITIMKILKSAPTGTPEIRAGRPLLYALCDKKKPDAVKVQRYLDDFKKVRSYITDLAVQWHFSPVERESWKNLLDDLDEMQTAPSAAFSGFWPQRKEEVDDFLREHGQTAPAEARHTMATNADLSNAEAARVEAGVRAQMLQDDSAFRGVHAGAKERLHDNTSPSDAKGSNLVVIDVSDTKGGKKPVDTSWEKCLTLPWKLVEAVPLSYAKAIHDASGSREVFNEDGTMCGMRAWHNTEPGQKAPLRDIMDMSGYTGMVFGTVAPQRYGATRELRSVRSGRFGHHPAASEFCRKCGKSTTVDGLPVVREEALVSAVTEAMYDRMNGHGHHMELPTGYSVDPSDPKAWPFLTAFDDPKVYAMRDLHALCEAHFMHPMDDSDALRDVMGWDSAHQSRHRFP
eukprot:jgi/Tetstr1/453888/TSEL_040808.t1